MLASKTSTVITIIEKYERKKKKCIIVNHVNDNRYSKDNVVHTHNGHKRESLKCACLSEVFDKIKEYEVIAVDEFQFYKKRSVSIIWLLLKNNKILIVAGLNGTYGQEGFSNMSALYPYMNRPLIWLTAVCDCGEDATYTILKEPLKDKKLEESKTQTEKTDFIKPGGSETYTSVCLTCYVKHTGETPKLELPDATE